jgi:hypothetical protein
MSPSPRSRTHGASRNPTRSDAASLTRTPAKLAAYRKEERHERGPDGPQRGQRTVEHWRGETLPMGLRYEGAAVDFWTDVVAKAGAAAREKAAEG